MNAIEAGSFEEHVEGIPGFLFPVAAGGTAWLLRHQEASGIRGGLLEIGVFQGKYFAVLARSAQTGGDRLLGIDSFVYSDEALVGRALDRHPDTRSADWRLWAKPSGAVTGQAIRSELAGPARFVSIDGSHDAPDVLADLGLAESVLSQVGVIAVDDFLNARALGVGEAVHRYFASRPPLLPFALFGNKLFLCRAAAAERYRDVVDGFFEETGLPEGQAYRDLSRLGREHVEQTLFGSRLLVM